MKSKKEVAITLPPVQFSNAMNEIYEHWDFRGWETSKEWRLFNAGRTMEARNMQYDAQRIADECMEIVRGR